METTDARPQEIDQDFSRWEENRRRGKVFLGLLIMAAGVLFLARELGAEIPYWLLSWKMVLVVAGIFNGIKHGFRNLFWLLPTGIGVALIVGDFFPGLIQKELIWPIVLIVLGFFVIFKPRNPKRMACRKNRMAGKFSGYQQNPNQSTTQTGNTGEFDSNLQLTSVFGGIEKTVLSKNFKQGEITMVMAGAEVNFTQADIADQATLEVTAVMAGISLILPANWEVVSSEVTCFMGAVEDKRSHISGVGEGERKLLILTGTAVLGGIEIKSY